MVVVDVSGAHFLGLSCLADKVVGQVIVAHSDVDFVAVSNETGKGREDRATLSVCVSIVADLDQSTYLVIQ